MECHNSTYHWPRCGLRMKCHNSTHHWPQKIDSGTLNDYKIFSTLVFLLKSRWVRRFFTDKSVALPFSEVILPLIDVAPRWLNQPWFDSRQLDSRWSRPTMVRPSTARSCSTQRKRGQLPTNGSIKKAKKHEPRGSSLGSVFLLSSHWVRRFFINPNLSVFPFVYCYLFQGFFFH